MLGPICAGFLLKDAPLYTLSAQMAGVLRADAPAQRHANSSEPSMPHASRIPVCCVAASALAAAEPTPSPPRMAAVGSQPPRAAPRPRRGPLYPSAPAGAPQ